MLEPLGAERFDDADRLHRLLYQTANSGVRIERLDGERADLILQVSGNRHLQEDHTAHGDCHILVRLNKDEAVNDNLDHRFKESPDDRVK